MTTSQRLSWATFQKRSLPNSSDLFSVTADRARLCRAVSHTWCRFLLFPFFPFPFPASSPAVSLLFAFLSSLPFFSFSSSGLSCFWGLFGLSLPRCVVSGFAHLVARVAPSGTPSSLGVPDAASLIEHPIQQALVGSNWRPGTHLIPAGLQFQPPNNQPA